MLKRLALGVILVGHLWAIAWGAEAPGKPLVDGARTKSYVAYLSSDAMEGRMTCTDGYRKAAEWVAANFKEWGLQPAGENGTYFQNVPGIRDLDWNTGVPALSIGQRAFLLDDGDFQVDTMSTPGISCQAEVVFVGYGIVAPDKGLNEYGGVDAKGKVVLAFKGSPKDAPAARQLFDRGKPEASAESKPEETWESESTDLSKIKTAYDQGAAAILLFDPNQVSDGEEASRRSSGRSTRTEFEPQRPFLCFTINERIFRAIMKQDPQESPRGLHRRIDNVRRAINTKQVQSKPTGVQATLKGYDVSVRYDEKRQNNAAPNVLAKIDGTHPELKNQYIIVGAHLDHVGVKNGYVSNGADDNASGSAVVMEVARVLSEAKFQPLRTLVFCCWTGEERGLLGSYHFTRQPCAGVSMDKVVAYFNLDMVGMGQTLGAPGALNFPAIWEVIKRDLDPEDLKRIEPSVGGPGGSDHSGFVTKGIQALALMSRGGVGHPDYHQPEDDIDKIEPEMLRLSGQFVLQGMMNVANETQVNLLVERRLELYQGLRIRVANLNPTLESSSWMQVEIKEDKPETFRVAMQARIRETLVKTASPSSTPRTSRSSRSPSSEPAPPPPAQDDARGRKSLGRGFATFELIGGDLELLGLVLDYYGIGRADIKADSAAFVADGRLTDGGKALLKALEDNGIAIRLVSPSESLITDFLAAATKPFGVTGSYTIPESAIPQLNARGVLWGVDFDPQAVTDFIERLEKLKNQLGERRNLFAYLASVKGLEESKQPLYMGLRDKGWAHNEICGGQEHQGLIGGATINQLVK